MKKLMFAVAAAASMIAVADLSSSNVVGYSQSGLCNGATITAPQFTSVSGTTVNLDDIKATGNAVDGTVSVSTLNSIGLKTASYIWTDDDGWCDRKFKPVSGVTFQPGEALWVEGNSSDQNVQSAGQVSKEDAKVQLCNGATMTGNFTPVEIDLQDIICEGEGIEGAVSLSTVDHSGIKTATYVWTDEGWCNRKFKKVSGVKIAAGQGVWIDGQNDNQFIVFPGVEL